LSSRIWEIDFIRGLAILAMVLFHLIVDLTDFFGYSFNYLSGFWYYEGKFAASTFMLLAGVSATLHNRNARRGITILAWGIMLSLVTFLYNPDTYIRYGILHLLGSCMLVFHFAQRMPVLLLLAIGSLFLAVGQWTSTVTPSTWLLIPFGMTPAGFVSIDFYPFFPWAGLFFYGSSLGKALYQTRQSVMAQVSGTSGITMLGRHSLAIYILHQPVLIALLWIYHSF